MPFSMGLCSYWIKLIKYYSTYIDNLVSSYSKIKKNKMQLLLTLDKKRRNKKET